MDQKALHALKASLSRAVQIARNRVNITFPKEFGIPRLLKINEGYAAFFPDNVFLRTDIQGKPSLIRPMAKGATPEEAMASLFREYADSCGYDGVIVQDPFSHQEYLFRANEYPFGTCGFCRVKTF